MYTGLANKDLRTVCRTLIIMLLFVIIGVSMAERQINKLTLQHDSVQFLNLQRDVNAGQYVFKFLGSQYRLGGILRVAKIANHPHNLEVSLGGATLVMPTYVGFDCTHELEWLDAGRRRSIQAAFWFKKYVTNQFGWLNKSLRESRQGF